MKKSSLALLAVLIACPLLLLQADAEKKPAKSPVPGRTRTNLPGVGYKDSEQVPGQKWLVHDATRPEPWIITPPTASTQEKPGKAPSDAVVLFDGKDLSKWVNGKGEAAQWKVENGYMEVNGTGSIKTKDGFGSCQLHVEWASPIEVKGDSQGRGNSGVMIMGLYEIQVLDSFNNRTYSDGQASAVYGQYPPLVNASRKPGEWQTYDIIFEAPQYDGDKVTQPGHFTILHNGILVHNRVKSLGRVAHKYSAKYAPHEDKLPLMLQDHNNPVRFRNIWIRPLTKYDEK